MIWYVSRDSGGAISFAATYIMPGNNDEALDDATSAELQAYRAQVTALSPDQAFAAALAGGLAIVSTGTKALNATYAIDAPQQQRISGIAAGISARNRLPGGGSTFQYPDLSGADHDFGATDFLNFAAAVEDYVYALSRGEAPSQPVTIA